MAKLKSIINYFSKTEIFLWSGSVALIIFSFMASDEKNYITLLSSVIGVTSLIFNAKGNPFGQLLMIIFGLLYGITSFTFRYYGEMITYLGMTVPIAILALVSWLRNPYNGKKSQVRVNNKLTKSQKCMMWILTITVTIIFYFILKAFDTPNLIPSTISISTSFLAAYLTVCRSAYFAAAYAANDIILIVLWVLASMQDVRYFSVVICFAAFLVNDLYAFVNWRAMGKRQAKTN